MKSILFTALCFVTSVGLSQEAFTFNQGGTTQADYFSVIPYQSIRNKIIVESVIAGETFRFIVDTGAPTTISQKLQDKLKAPVLTRLSIVDQSGLEDSMQVISLPAITLGDVTFNNIPALVAEQTLMLDCFGVDGFIGSNLLRNSIVQFNHQKKTITLTDSEIKLSLDSTQATAMHINKVQSSPFIIIRLEGKKKGSEQLLFDSGMEGMYDLCLRNFKLFKNKKIFDVLSKATGSNSLGFHGTADDAIQYKLQLPILKINGVSIYNVPVQTTTDSNSRIGSQVLEAGLATLDYRNGKFYFEAFSDQPINMHQKGFPIEPVYRDGQLQVGIVWKKELLGKLNPGDQILAVNETSYESFDVCVLLTKEPAYKTQQQITLTIKNQAGVVQKIVLERE